MGLGNPCSPHDHDLFAAATSVTTRNGKKAIFLEAAWLNGMRPKDVAPLIFELSKKKRCTVQKIVGK
jgi:hypothetical protein